MPCIGDQEGCLNEFLEGGHPQCAVNPRTGFEDVLPCATPPPAAAPRRVAVVGAGPAGIALRLHRGARAATEVTLFERGSAAGGMLVPGSRPRIKFDVANYLAYLEGLLARARARGCGWRLRLDTPATAEALRSEGVRRDRDLHRRQAGASRPSRGASCRTSSRQSTCCAIRRLPPARNESWWSAAAPSAARRPTSLPASSASRSPSSRCCRTS